MYAGQRGSAMRRFLVFSLVIAVLAFVAGAAQADGPFRDRIRERVQQRMQERTQQQGPVDEAEIAGLSVAYWLPPEGAYPAPLVVFSHGFGGCKTQSVFLMRAMAQHGYVVVAPDHADARCGGGEGGFSRPKEKFHAADNWSDKTYADRGQDIRALVAALQKDETWARRIDWAHVALAGHSLGGYTALGLAGAWPSWKMGGVQAVLALSPYAAPYAQGGDLAHLNVPVMYQSGTRDLGIKPALLKEGGVFEKTSAPAWYVEFDKTGHFGWTDLQKGAQENIVRYSLWFLDHALKGSKEPLGRAEGVADLRAK